MKHLQKSSLKRILIKNLIVSHKNLLFEIVDYLREFDIPEINKQFMYTKEYMIEEMEEFVKRHGCFALVDRIDYTKFKSYHNFFNYDKRGKIYSISDDHYFINLLSCVDVIVDEVMKDPELLKL